MLKEMLVEMKAEEKAVEKKVRFPAEELARDIVAGTVEVFRDHMEEDDEYDGRDVAEVALDTFRDAFIPEVEKKIKELTKNIKKLKP